MDDTSSSGRMEKPTVVLNSTGTSSLSIAWLPKSRTFRVSLDCTNRAYRAR